MKYAVPLLTAALLASSSGVAQADTATPLTPFGLQYRQRLPDRCPDARQAANAVASAGYGVDPGQAHRATRAFIDCTKLLRPDAKVDDYLVLLAGSSELLAAQHETGDAAAASERNAIALLSPIGSRDDPFYSVTYHDAPTAFGTAAIVPTVRQESRVFPHDPSGLATIANILIRDAQGALTARKQ